MRLTIIGCGDAFGAGGQLQTSFHVRSDSSTFLIDCGVTTLIGMNRLGLATNEIGMVCVPICMAIISAVSLGSSSTRNM